MPVSQPPRWRRQCLDHKPALSRQDVCHYGKEEEEEGQEEGRASPTGGRTYLSVYRVRWRCTPRLRRSPGLHQIHRRFFFNPFRRRAHAYHRHYSALCRLPTYATTLYLYSTLTALPLHAFATPWRAPATLRAPHSATVDFNVASPFTLRQRVVVNPTDGHTCRPHATARRRAAHPLPSTPLPLSWTRRGAALSTISLLSRLAVWPVMPLTGWPAGLRGREHTTRL